MPLFLSGSVVFGDDGSGSGRCRRSRHLRPVSGPSSAVPVEGVCELLRHHQSEIEADYWPPRTNPERFEYEVGDTFVETVRPGLFGIEVRRREWTVIERLYNHTSADREYVLYYGDGEGTGVEKRRLTERHLSESDGLEYVSDDSRTGAGDSS